MQYLRRGKIAHPESTKTTFSLRTCHLCCSFPHHLHHVKHIALYSIRKDSNTQKNTEENKRTISVFLGNMMHSRSGDGAYLKPTWFL